VYYIILILLGVFFLVGLEERIFFFSCTVYAVRFSGIRVSVRLYLNERRSTCECFNVCCCFYCKNTLRLRSARLVCLLWVYLWPLCRRRCRRRAHVTSAYEKPKFEVRKVAEKTVKERKRQPRGKRMRKWGQLYTIKPRRCISRERERESWRVGE